MEEALDRVLELVVLLDDDATSALASLGLTASRAHLLWELRRLGPVTQQVLARALRVTPRAVTGLLDALEAGGLVTREPHPSDRRAALVTFTAAGEELVARLERDHKALARSLFGPMSGPELAAFSGGLAEVIGRLRAQLASTDPYGTRSGTAAKA